MDVMIYNKNSDDIDKRLYVLNFNINNFFRGFVYILLQLLYTLTIVSKLKYLSSQLVAISTDILS